MGDVDLGTVAAGVAWELARLPAAVRARELARIRRESFVFSTLVEEALAQQAEIRDYALAAVRPVNRQA